MKQLLNPPSLLPPKPKHKDDGEDNLWLLVQIGDEIIKAQRTSPNGYGEDWNLIDTRGNTFSCRPRWEHV